MEPRATFRDAVLRCIETRDHSVMEERASALADVAALLEEFVWERLDDKPLAASLDGLDARQVVTDGRRTLEIRGAFYTLGMRAPGTTEDRMLPMDAHFSVEPGAVSVVRVSGREGLFEVPASERQFQRGFERAVWRYAFQLLLT